MQNFIVGSVAPPGALFLAAVPVVALWGLALPAAQGIMTRHIGPTEQGALQGATGSVMGIATMIGPALFAATFAYFRRRHALACARGRVPAGRGAAGPGRGARDPHHGQGLKR